MTPSVNPVGLIWGCVQVVEAVGLSNLNRMRNADGADRLNNDRPKEEDATMTVPGTDRSTPVDWATAPVCPFAKAEQRRELKPREPPYWHSVAMCRQIGIYIPHPRVCTWIARVMTIEGRYVQHRLASAREGDPAAVDYKGALGSGLVLAS